MKTKTFTKILCGALGAYIGLSSCTPHFQVSLKPTQKAIKTPEEAHALLNSFWKYQIDTFSPEQDDWRSLNYSFRKGGGNCEDYALSSIALLVDDGYPPLILCLKSDYIKFKVPNHTLFIHDKQSHGVHLLYKDGKFGINTLKELIPPKYETLEDLIIDWPVTNFKLSEGYFLVLYFPKIHNIVDAKHNIWKELMLTKHSTPWLSISPVLNQTTQDVAKTFKQNQKP